MLRRVALIITDVPEECSASIISVTRIGDLEATLAITSNRRTLRRNTTIATGRNISEDGILHSHRHENLKYCKSPQCPNLRLRGVPGLL
jgi:hypothetical protein